MKRLTDFLKVGRRILILFLRFLLRLPTAVLCYRMSTSDDRAINRGFRKLDRILDELLKESRTEEEAHEWLRDTWTPAEVSSMFSHRVCATDTFIF